MAKEIMLILKEVMDSKGITRYELAKRTDIKYQIIDNYYKNTVTRYDGGTLLKICLALDCEVGDIIKIKDLP
ncbi:MAG: helix-turn-helix transcriptional regulator [Defluviitaleaceae bacterium]|nr:helix-turn-helix transcriptional regulator [Defluviitaleaceae bacterium]